MQPHSRLLRVPIVHANISAVHPISGDVMSITRGLLLATIAVLCVGRANAQVDAAGTKILIPVVSSSVSFVS